MILTPPNRDVIVDGKSPQPVTPNWLTWFRQLTTGINFISPTLAAGQTASIDFTGAQKLSVWPGFLVLLFTTVASNLTVTLPTGPQNSIVVISSAVGVAHNVVIDATWTLTAGTWITLISDGTYWYKIMGGSL